MDQKQPNSLFSEEELEKVRVARARAESTASPEVDEYWIFVSKFGYYYGWEGVQALKNKELKLDQAKMMIEAAKIIRAEETVDMAIAVQAALASIYSENKNAFKDAMKYYLDLAGVS